MRIIIVLLLILFGCSTKEVVKKEYVETPLPILSTFQAPEDFDFGDLSNKETFVCLVDWENTCVPKAKFLDLFEYILDLNQVIASYRIQVEVYEYHRLEGKK